MTETNRLAEVPQDEQAVRSLMHSRRSAIAHFMRRCLRIARGTCTHIALACGLAAVAQPSLVSAQCFVDSDHFRYAPELMEAIDALAFRYPNLVQVIDYGDSYTKTIGGSGYDLKAIRITNRAVPGTKPIAMFVAGHHGTERPGPEILMRFAQSLLSSYGRLAQETVIIDHQEVWIAPVVNPDTLGRSRLNARGVDLNRNHSFQWLASGTVNGSGPASEPEVRALETLAANVFASLKSGGPSEPLPLQTPGMLVTFHAYFNSVTYPWLYSTSAPPNLAPLKNLVTRLARFNGYRTGQASVLHYTSSGTSNDWAFGYLGIPAVQIEVDGASTTPFAAVDNNYWPVNQGALSLLNSITRAPLALIDAPVIENARITQSGGLHTLTVQATSGSASPRPIDRVEYFIDLPPWKSGATTQAMSAVDGQFNTSSEAAQAVINVQGLSASRHVLFVRARDTSGALGPVQAVWLNLSTNTAPRIVNASPAPTTEVAAFSGQRFTVSASDAEADDLTYTWLLDGRVVRAGAGDTYTYFPSDADIGNRTLTVRVADAHGESQQTWQVNVAPNTAAIPVISDDASPTTQKVGLWTVQSVSSAYGGRYQYTWGTADSLTWNPTLRETGDHALFVRWPYAASNGTAVTLRISHDGGDSIVYVNQRDRGTGDSWQWIGIFPLTPGINGKVRATGAGNRVNADAILWVKSNLPATAVEGVIDNKDATTARTGTWTSSQLGLPWGDSALLSSGTATFRWTPAITRDGNYEVYARWTHGSTRAMVAPYRVLHADGSTLVR
ncbi:MAG: hypothetical protein FJY37_12930 [Betaproteobacteria bacterium]|nr:hypothetical protein [Betaproteobacteria bacterium]